MKTAKLQRREFLQLAKVYSGKEPIAGWYASEKMDGVRSFWDGGLTRGLKTASIPWANITDPKTGKPKAKIPEYSTGLWSRYGNPINAPDWFLDQLPPYPLDGELWAGRGKFQTTVSIISRDVPDDRWRQISYAVYGTPPINRVFQSGEIKNTNFHKVIDQKEISYFIAACVETRCPDFKTLHDDENFESELLALKELDSSVAFCHMQIKLPLAEKTAKEALDTFFHAAIDKGGEGLIVRDPNAIWTPKRVAALLKVKDANDDCGTIVGFTSGRETDKGSKHLGKIGALILDYNGKRLELAGLTDEEREFESVGQWQYATEHPGEDMPSSFQGKHFKVGQVVEFVYRELTNDGVPKEARYKRQRETQ